MDLIALFRSTFGGAPDLLASAPGRVNLLGEHVDYNQGPVLPASIDRKARIAAGRGEGRIASLYAVDLEAHVSFDLDALESKTDTAGEPLPEWVLYPAGVAWALERSGQRLPGLRAVYTSDVPIGAGLSSSAAIEVAFAVAWQGLARVPAERMWLAERCQQGENVYVGLASGLMDQFASLFGVAGHAIYFDTRSLDWEALPLPAGTGLVIADSGIRRKLTMSAYNERRESCEEAVRLLQRYLPDIHSLRDVSPQEFAALSAFLPPAVAQRAEHVVKEIARVESAVRALRTDNPRAFGALMYAGHASLQNLYEVSIPELDSLVEIARGLPGVYGARLTGAGFGGCTVNLVEVARAAEIACGLEEEYRRRTGRTAEVYICQASDGASFRDLTA